MSEPRRLPIVDSLEVQSSIDPADGHRKFVYTADVHGRFTKYRRLGFAALIAIWIAAPLVRVGQHPLVFLDVEHRKFFLFGASFNAQDVWLMFFVLTGIAFTLAFLTSILGRVWCGWMCPQTVFLDFIFRPIERFVEGPREKRMRRDKGPWTLEKTARKLVKHVLYLGAAFFVAHVVLSFFVSIPAVLKMVVHKPSEHPEAFGWAAAMTLLFYGNFAFFREQLCLIVCPYGRLQASFVDADSLVIGYDQKRGEPRGKATGAARSHSAPDKGDCVDCNRCVVVCPTGIDIRNGLQLDCIGCAACIDACDDIMDKLGRKRGLVRYDSDRGLKGEERRILRPRLYVYMAMGVAGVVAFSIALFSRKSFEANLLRSPGAAFVTEGDTVRDAFNIHLVNKRDAAGRFTIAVPSDGLSYSVASTTIELGPLQDTKIGLVVSSPKGQSKDRPFILDIRREDDGEVKHVEGRFVGPGR
jgi:cytochrome c oxidase accessory protein FixG